MAKGRKTGGKSWNFKDLIDQKFNRLLVVSLNRIDANPGDTHRRTFWNCLCDCGNDAVVESHNLRSEAVKSCGCYRNEQIKERCFIDLTGMRFGKLLVLDIAYKNKTGGYYWNTVCDCGNPKVAGGAKLRGGRAQSCGCIKFEEKFGKATFNHLYAQYVKTAQYRNLSFELNQEDFKTLISGNCFYCGIIPLQVVKSKYGCGDLIYNGIDRVDSSIGYTTENVVSCCGTCNVAKMAMSKEDFLSWIERVYKHSFLNT